MKTVFYRRNGVTYCHHFRAVGHNATEIALVNAKIGRSEILGVVPGIVKTIPKKLL